MGMPAVRARTGITVSRLNRRQLIAGATAAIAVGAGSPFAFAQEAAQLQINSSRYIVTDAETGAIYAQKSARERVAIASLTKVFTAVQAVSMAPLDTEITTVSDDLQSAEATTMGFSAGETFTLEDLLYGMLLPSGNDAAHAIARALAQQPGDSAKQAVQRFMDLLNQRILDMGLQDTHLLNPDGWGVEGHYSSAADVAAFTAYAAQHPAVLKAMGTYQYTTSDGRYTLTNTNKVLNSSPSVIGGKTGYDNDSGWCLVQIAQRSNATVIAVTLDGVAPDDWYNDNLTLLDYGFQQETATATNFDGEHVTWHRPEAAVFAQSAAGSAAIAGDTSSGDHVETVAEGDLPEAPQVGRPDGSGRSGLWWAAVPAAAAVAGAALDRWSQPIVTLPRPAKVATTPDDDQI